MKIKNQKSKFNVSGHAARREPEIENGVRIANRETQTGFTLLELIITLTVLAILVMGTLPLAQNAAKRQKELRLRENLRTMRTAIDEFHRDTVGACNSGNTGTVPGGLGGPTSVDPRSRVVIDDCKIFDTENFDRYPPSIEILVEGVKVKPRALQINTGGGVFGESTNVFKEENSEKKKVYLRELPIDPMTGEKDWKFRSSLQSADEGSWDEVNVFDVRSSSEEEALNGEKYSDW